jgi:hypothetical protein
MHGYTVMELATCDIEVDVTSYFLVRTEKEGVATM